jgi:recombination protein RecA
LPKKKATETNESATKTEVQAKLLMSKYGDVVRKTEVAAVKRSLCLPTPSISLNILTNEAGLRPGVTTEWYGLPGVTKTRTALQMCKMAMDWAPDKHVAFIDVEGDVDLFSAQEEIGIDFEAEADGFKRFVYWPDATHDQIPNLDDIMARVEDFVASGLFSLIIIDSVAAVQSAWQEKAGNPTDTKAYGASSDLQAAFRRIKPKQHRSGTRLWLINQMYTTTVHTPRGPMAKDVSKGGYAIKYAASMRFKASWKESAKEDDEHSILRVLAEKVKYGRSDRYVEIPVLNGLIDAEADLVVNAVTAGIVTKSGSWFNYAMVRLGQGLMASANMLRENPSLFSQIYSETLDVLCPENTEPYLETPPDGGGEENKQEDPEA